MEPNVTLKYFLLKYFLKVKNILKYFLFLYIRINLLWKWSSIYLEKLKCHYFLETEINCHFRFYKAIVGIPTYKCLFSAF